MNKKIKILIFALTLFIFFSAGFFTYYKVYEHQEKIDKYVTRTIKWDDYITNKPQTRIKLYNTTTKDFEEYELDDINLNEIISSSKDIVKEVKKYSNIKLEKEDLPELLEFDQNTQLKLSKIIVDPIITKEKGWQDEIESQIKYYNNIENADLINIPKEIYENNETWFLLTDTLKFDDLDGIYNCTATYHRIKRVEEENSRIDRYSIKAIYSGKMIYNSGNVYLKYKLTSRSTIKEVLPRLSFKFLAVSAILSIFMVSIILIYKSLSTNNKKR